MKTYSLEMLERAITLKEPCQFTRAGQVVMTYHPIEGLQEIPARPFTQPLAAMLLETIVPVNSGEAVPPVSHRHARNIAATVGRLMQWDRIREGVEG